MKKYNDSTAKDEATPPFKEFLNFHLNGGTFDTRTNDISW